MSWLRANTGSRAPSPTNRTFRPAHRTTHPTWSSRTAAARVALEVTELVNEEAIDAQIQGRADYFAISYAFDAAAAVQRLGKIVLEKDRAARNVRYAYADYLLLIHCAEPLLSRVELASAAAIHPWPETPGIRAAYLMFDYFPGDPYPIVKLFERGF
jgi:hypothetical protein